MNDRVLLTNGQLKKTLSAVRSLGKRNIEVYCAEETLMNISGFSRYCVKNLVCPSPEKRPEDYMAWLDETIYRYGITVYMPMDDAAMRLAVSNRALLSQKVKLVAPEETTYALASDKWQSVLLAQKAGFDVPKSILPSCNGDLVAFDQSVGYPAVVKPRFSSGSRGIRVVHNEEELIDTYQNIYQQYPAPIIQQKVPTGPRFDVCLLFDRHSNLKASFVQQEIRHFPIEMGPSTVQRSVKLPELTAKCAKMLGQIGWVGVAEVEFMLDISSGKYYFMEINPRFWNSLELAVHCGIDFPYALYKIAQEEETSESHAYEEDLYCRNLLPADILHFLASRDRFHMNPPLFGTMHGRIHDDLLSWRDPLPLAGFFAAVLKYSFDLKMWKFYFGR